MIDKIITDKARSDLELLLQKIEALVQHGDKAELYEAVKDPTFMMILVHWFKALTRILLCANTKFQEIESRLEKIEQKLDQ